jgi:hypothetical protein
MNGKNIVEKTKWPYNEAFSIKKPTLEKDRFYL